MYQFEVIAGPDKGKRFTLNTGPDLFVGRGNHTLYQLTDPRVSRTHSQVVVDGDQITVICLGGSGGTLVNGKAISKQVLKLGDLVQVGDTQMRLTVGDYPVNVVEGAFADQAKGKAIGGTSIDKLAALSGSTLSHYLIGPVIGKGNSCMVFHATDTRDDAAVALKILSPEFAANDDEMQHFVRAMKTVLPLRHPNIVAVLGAGKAKGYCWIAMEFIAGENMMQVISRLGVANMLDWRYAFKVAVHVARALAYAHGEKIVHRNVTPRNILLDTPSKTVKLGDLMFAKALEGTLAKPITKPGELVGDVAYMAPERTRGPEHIDGRSDIYGLGATCYALLAGRAPFEGRTLVEQITRIRQDEPTPPTKFQMSIPTVFEGVVLKMLAKNPNDRFQTAEELLKALDKVGKTKGVSV